MHIQGRCKTLVRNREANAIRRKRVVKKKVT